VRGAPLRPGTGGGRRAQADARAWVLTDLRGGEYLAGEDASERLPTVSTTEIMDAS
jgi:hypothetical protein